MADIIRTTFAQLFITMVIVDLMGGVTPDPIHGCEYGNHVFRVGENFMKNECEPCVCDAKMGISCVAILCQDNACVDALRAPGECCTVCPNGPNCRHGNNVIPAGKDVLIGGLNCRCPDEKTYPPHSVNAVCS